MAKAARSGGNLSPSELLRSLFTTKQAQENPPSNTDLKYFCTTLNQSKSPCGEESIFVIVQKFVWCARSPTRGLLHAPSGAAAFVTSTFQNPSCEGSSNIFCSGCKCVCQWVEVRLWLQTASSQNVFSRLFESVWNVLTQTSDAAASGLTLCNPVLTRCKHWDCST